MADTTSPPTISVVVNNYNYAQFLVEALDNALSQLREGDELVVVDDGSTDDSRDILRSYEGSPGVRVIRQENQGQMKAVRTGIEAARGDILALLDSDDYYLPGYLDRVRDIFAARPEISVVFTGPEVSGPDADSVRTNRDVLDRMELPPGDVGTTRWATALFYEFVGVPTSGNAIRGELAKKIISLPGEVDKTQEIDPLRVKILGLSESDAKKFGFSADGVLVRVSSLLGARKYYEQERGWVYRIHGGNKYAQVRKLGRLYLRNKLRKTLLTLSSDHFGLTMRPTARELREEVLGRSFGLRPRRNLHIRARYCLASVTARGTLRERLGALAAAAGLVRGAR